MILFFPRAYVNNILNEISDSSLKLSIEGYKLINEFIYQVCNIIFHDKKDVYKIVDLTINSPYSETVTGYSVKYSDIVEKNDLKIGKSIKNYFKVAVDDDTSLLFMVGGLRYIIDYILTEASDIISEESTLTNKHINEIIQRDIMQELLVYRPFIINDMHFNLDKHKDKYSFSGHSFTNKQNVIYRDFPKNFYKLPKEPLIILAYNMKLGKRTKLKGMKKAELVELVYPYMPIAIKRVSIKKTRK
jgi:hypothetical protein